MDIIRHEQWFADYAAKKLTKADGDTSPMELKIVHTQHVFANARAIAEIERFSPAVARTCLLAALYHDVARFEQYLQYHTFKDRESCNHGLMGIKILKREKILEMEEKATVGIVLAAVGLHNRFALPRSLPENLYLTAQAVRDADKLDILRVMDEHLSGPKPYCPTVVLNLPDSGALVSETVIQAALEERVASYADLRSVNDFRLLLGTWFFDMRFTASRRRFAEDGHALRLLEALPSAKPYGPARDSLLTRLRRGREN